MGSHLIPSDSVVHRWFLDAHVAYLATQETMGVKLDAASEAAAITFALPSDFTAVTSVKLLLYSAGNITSKNVTVRTIYGGINSEVYTTHDTGNVNKGFSATGNIIEPIDITADFASASAGDGGAVFVTYVDTAIYVMGVIVEFY